MRIKTQDTRQEKKIQLFIYVLISVILVISFIFFIVTTRVYSDKVLR